MNHILILSGSRVYCYGDHTKGALGNVFKNDEKTSRLDWEKLTCINKRNIAKIYTTDYCSFIVTHPSKHSQKDGKFSEKIYCFGLNNFQQLGFESLDEKNYIEKLPVQWTEIYGE